MNEYGERWVWVGQSLNWGWCLYCEEHYSLHRNGSVVNCIQQEIMLRDGEILELKTQLKMAQQDAAFYRCCAMSGEYPITAANPSAGEKIDG